MPQRRRAASVGNAVRDARARVARRRTGSTLRVGKASVTARIEPARDGAFSMTRAPEVRWSDIAPRGLCASGAIEGEESADRGVAHRLLLSRIASSSAPILLAIAFGRLLAEPPMRLADAVPPLVVIVLAAHLALLAVVSWRLCEPSADEAGARRRQPVPNADAGETTASRRARPRQGVVRRGSAADALIRSRSVPLTVVSSTRKWRRRRPRTSVASLLDAMRPIGPRVETSVRQTRARRSEEGPDRRPSPRRMSNRAPSRPSPAPTTRDIAPRP